MLFCTGSICKLEGVGTSRARWHLIQFGFRVICRGLIGFPNGFSNPRDKKKAQKNYYFICGLQSFAIVTCR